MLSVVSAALTKVPCRLDHLVGVHNLFKVETIGTYSYLLTWTGRWTVLHCLAIGDAFMCVSNLHVHQPTDHVKRIADFSLEAIEAANNTLINTDEPQMGCINLRVGFHTGTEDGI